MLLTLARGTEREFGTQGREHERSIGTVRREPIESQLQDLDPVSVDGPDKADRASAVGQRGSHQPLGVTEFGGPARRTEETAQLVDSVNVLLPRSPTTSIRSVLYRSGGLMHVISQGHRVHYLAAGEGEPLVLIPAHLQAAQDWVDQATRSSWANPSRIRQEPTHDDQDYGLPCEVSRRVERRIDRAL
jgi:hypothetical protein